MDKEQRAEEFAADLSAIYLALSIVLFRLPIPIQLPTAPEYLGECGEALSRALALILDEPITEDLQIELVHCCIDWLVADDLLSHFVLMGEKWRAAVITRNIACAKRDLLEATRKLSAEE